MTETAPWSAAREPLDEERATVLIRAACSDLEHEHAVRVGEGFDFEIFRVADLAFRFPKRAEHAERLEREAQLLEFVDEVTSLPTPRVVRGPFTVDGFPWPFAAMQWLPGRLMLTEDPHDYDVVRLGRQLGNFIGELRAVPAEQVRARCPEIPTWLPDLGEWQRRQVDRLELLAPFDELDLLPRLRRFAASAGVPEVSERAEFVHGDLHGENLVLAHGQVAGVLDFGDLCLGDVAFDLAGLAAWGGHAMLDAALVACDEDREETRARALWLAIWLSVFGAISYTQQDAKRSYVRPVLRTLEALL